MTKIEKPKELVRTTIGETGLGDLPMSGVYIVAYLKKIIYVGKAQDVSDRLRSHIHGAHRSLFGAWLRLNEDWENIRLDVLVQPDEAHKFWLGIVEKACIKKFNPLFNLST